MANKRPSKPRPKRERELHAKSKLADLLDADTRNALEDLKRQLAKETKA